MQYYRLQNIRVASTALGQTMQFEELCIFRRQRISYHIDVLIFNLIGVVYQGNLTLITLKIRNYNNIMSKSEDVVLQIPGAMIFGAFSRATTFAVLKRKKSINFILRLRVFINCMDVDSVFPRQHNSFNLPGVEFLYFREFLYLFSQLDQMNYCVYF